MSKKRSATPDSDDDDLDDELLGLGKTSSTAPPPAKKQKLEASNDDMHSESEFDDGFQEDMMGDEADRAYLQSLTENKREQILYERFLNREKLKVQKEKLKAAGKLKSRKSAVPSVPPKRGSAAQEIKAVKENALSDLKMRREAKKQQTKDVSKKKKGSDDEDADYLDKEDDYDDEDETIKFPSKSAAPVKQQQQQQQVEQETTEEPLSISLDNLKKAIVKRLALEKLWQHQNFDTKIVGAFVRICLGQNEKKEATYRLGQIEEVKKAKRAYKFGGHSSCEKALSVKIAGSSKLFSMDRVSNKSTSDSEFRFFADQTLRSGEELPDIVHINKTHEAIAKMDKETKKIFNADEPKTFAIALQLLESNIEVYQDELESCKTNEQRNEIVMKLAKAEEEIKAIKSAQLLHATTNANTDKIELINQKNKRTNEKNAQKLKESQKTATAATTLDPFARRSTQSRGLVFFAKETASPSPATEGLAPVSIPTPTNNSQPIPLSPIKSPSTAQQQQHLSFKLDLDFDKLAPQAQTQSFATPAVIIQPIVVSSTTKKISLSDYKKKKN